MISEGDSVHRWSSPQELEFVAKPRPVRLSKTGKAGFFGTLVLSVITGSFYGYFFFVQFQEHRRYELLQNAGVSATATVSEKRYFSGKGAHYRLVYDYLVGGQKYQNKAWVSSGDFQHTETGAQVQMIYLPSQPQTARLSMQRDNNGALKIFSLFPFFTLIPFAAVFIRAAKQKQLIQYGDAAGGTVEKVKRMKNGFSVSYRFQDGAGQNIQGKSYVNNRNVPSEGDTVTIVYLPTRSSQNTLYPAPMVDLISSSF